MKYGICVDFDNKSNTNIGFPIYKLPASAKHL